MRRKLQYISGLLFLGLCAHTNILSQHSIARQWNEVLLDAIRGDFARPTVHARNLFHVSTAMYDAWAAYDPVAETYLLGKNVKGFPLPFDGIPMPNNIQAARNEAISYAAYRLITYRFSSSPGVLETLQKCNALFMGLGYDLTFTSTDYSTGNPAALGNYIAEGLIRYGQQDGANEDNDYANQYYQTVNPPLIPVFRGNPFIRQPNRWQALSFDLFIDQSGNPLNDAPPFLSPEWGQVTSFSLTSTDRKTYWRDGHSYWVYHDPGPPPYATIPDGGHNTPYFQWGFALVSMWASHLEPSDDTMWDISPASIGNIDMADYPTTWAAYPNFYDAVNGGDISKGHTINPATNQPYAPQMVHRADYARVLAEFWADGPDSETPPGHWFTILNYVHDHPLFERKFKGEGSVLDELEWDVKAYLALGGAMHDAAIAAWSIKGYYDYVRPISAIRWMASQGQSSDPTLNNYDSLGIPLVEGLIEVVQEGDALAGGFNQHIGKIKLYTWRGPNYITDPMTTHAGVGWILAENWWPYQRPTFVTPPFAGYVSGHSTFSRAAAEVMTLLTGDPFFPGGMGEFVAKKDEFLVFENGPSEDIVLQWATYRDASDQTSLSRIWGGIHPPADDIPGRIIGEKVGIAAFAFAEKYFNGTVEPISLFNESFAAPNPIANQAPLTIALNQPTTELTVQIFAMTGQLMQQAHFINPQPNYTFATFRLADLRSGIYIVQVNGDNWEAVQRIVVME